jgi:hypothetical protein
LTSTQFFPSLTYFLLSHSNSVVLENKFINALTSFMQHSVWKHKSHRDSCAILCLLWAKWVSFSVLKWVLGKFCSWLRHLLGCGWKYRKILFYFSLVFLSTMSYIFKIFSSYSIFHPLCLSTGLCTYLAQKILKKNFKKK